jgi:hypothetical protein
MSVVISDRELSTRIDVIGLSSFALHERALHPNVSLKISISDFGFHLSAPLIDYTPTLESGEVTLRASVDKNVVALLTLTGELRRGTSILETERFSFSVELSKQEPRALFIASSIMAMLGIAGEMEIHIAELEMGQKVTFDMPLLVTSGRLEQRLMAYRLMVIEEAIGKKLLIPSFISRDDLGSIAFIYHAIVDRNFVWPSTHTFDVSVSANSMGRAQASIDKPTTIRFDSIPLSRKLFGQTISLGHAAMIVEDAIVQNPEEVSRELASDDGHEVRLAVRSQSGEVRYEFHEAPHFHPKWSTKIKILVDLESQLDARLVARYNDLAAATLAGLSEKEKEEITERPVLDESAFEIDE